MLVLRGARDGATAAGACDVTATIGRARAYLIGGASAGAGGEQLGAPLQVHSRPLFGAALVQGGQKRCACCIAARARAVAAMGLHKWLLHVYGRPAPQACCIAEALPAAAPAPADPADATPRRPEAALAADVRWDPAAAPDPGLVDRAWAFVRDQALAAAAAGAGGDGKGARPSRGAAHLWPKQGLRVAACACGRHLSPATGFPPLLLGNPGCVAREVRLIPYLVTVPYARQARAPPASPRSCCRTRWWPPRRRSRACARRDCACASPARTWRRCGTWRTRWPRGARRTRRRRRPRCRRRCRPPCWWTRACPAACSRRGFTLTLAAAPRTRLSV